MNFKQRDKKSLDGLSEELKEISNIQTINDILTVIVSHHMVMGLDGSDKMSKSDPDNAIFMDDSEQEVKRKMKKAYCKPKEIEGNPPVEKTVPPAKKPEIDKK